MTADERTDVLEGNIDQLVTRAHQPPRMDAAARARILAALVERQQSRAPVPTTRRRYALAAGGACVAAVAAAAWLVMARPASPAQFHANVGVAPLVVTSGASTFTLRPGAIVARTGDRALTVHRGQVLLDIAPGPAFHVQSPHGDVAVVGTRFLVDARADATSTAVVRGSVVLANARGKVTLRAGEQGELRDGHVPTRSAAPRLTHLTSWAKQARVRHEGHASEPMRRGSLLARQPEGWGQSREWPLPMRDLTVDVHVADQVARVAVDQTFFNHVNQNLEGVYQFPLPHDAAVSRLAMYVDDTLVESAVVERQRGRDVYESIVYRRRDPALLEWMQGNLFKVRIFPLPARTEKRILLSYTQPLAKLYDGYRLEVPIPDVDEPVRNVSFRVRVADCADCDVTSSSHAVSVASEGEDRLVTFRASQHTIGDDLLLHVRPPAARAVRTARSGDYVLAAVQPELGGQATYQRRSWVVLFDTSASRGALELEAQAHLLDALLGEMDEYDDVAIMAMDARVRAFGEGFARVMDVSRADVRAFLTAEAAGGVGYTDLDGALEAAIERLQQADGAPHILYVGDGIATGGARDLDALRARVRGSATVVAVAVGDTLDAQVLGALADETGGLFSAINPGEDLRWRAFDLVATLNTPRVLGLRAQWLDDEGRPLAATAYTGTRQLADGEEVVAVGKLGDRAPAALLLRGTVDGDEWQQTVPVVADAKQGDAGYLPRLWARRHLDALLRDGAETHKSEITALGLEHFLMTPFTSLLVLENDAMYTQYKIDRSRAAGWARYDVPDKIEVVVEPLGSRVADAPLDPAAVIVRTPAPYIHHYAAPQLRWSGQVAAGPMVPVGGGGVIVTGALERTRGWGSGRGRMGTIGGLDFATNEDAREVAANRGVLASRQQPAADVFQTVVTTTELRDTRGRDWAQPVEKAKAGEGKWADAVGGKGSAHTRYYSGYGYAPQPAAFTYEGDPRLDDLTELVPGLFASGYDAARRALVQGATEVGSVSDDARALVLRSRGAIEPQRFRIDGEVIDIDARGRFAIARTTDAALRERVTYDGTTLVASYPELGLAVRRSVGNTTPALYAAYAPFLLPTVDDLARWYTVTVRDGRTLVLRAVAEDGETTEIDLDARGRVVAVRVVGDARSEVRFEYDATELRIVGPQATVVLAREPTPGSVDPVVAADAVWVDMPARQPSALEATRATETAGSAPWRLVTQQLLASHAALANDTAIEPLIRDLADDGGLFRGELVLASRALAKVTDRKLRARVLARVGAKDPVARYWQAAWQLRARGNDTRGFASLAADEAGTAIGMVSAYRDLIKSLRYGTKLATARRKLAAFDDRYDYAPLLYVAVHRFGQQFAWRSSTAATEAWDRLATDPQWHYVARYEAARVLSNRGQYSQAAERFEALLRDTVDAGHEPYIDWAFRNAFVSGGRGQAGWRLVWSQWRARVVRKRDPHALLSFLRAATQLGEVADIDRVVAPFRAVAIDDVVVAGELADALMALGRADHAWMFIAPWVEERTLADVPEAMLARASVVAEQQGRLADAAAFSEATLDREEPATLGQVRAAYMRVFHLHARMSHASGAAGQAALAKALAAAAAWRRLDPDNPTIDRMCATALYVAGRDDEAWRYLSSVIERHPGEGVAYEQVASALESEGRIEQADPWWQRAVQVEPTNPTWRLRRAQNLMALGRDEPARALIDEIVEGRWQARFSNVVWQAKHLRTQLR